MRILGIETSCDETSVAVLEKGRKVLAHTLATSLAEHARYGGIIPEIASRRQMEFIAPVVEQTLQASGCQKRHIHAIAYTEKPGLIGSLLVGMAFARGLALAWQKPLIPIDHIEAHLYANWLYGDCVRQKPQRGLQLPAVGLVVSGGHSSVFLMRSFQKFERLGQTQDDAAGEAFDKVAKILGLGYPGGPAIQQEAADAPPGRSRWVLRCEGGRGPFDFSFSGIKTAVLYAVRKEKRMTRRLRKEIAAAFQASVTQTLVKKTLAAADASGCRVIVVGGGVAANSQLRSLLIERARERGIKVFFPSLPLCLDNAAMVAGLAAHRRQRS